MASKGESGLQGGDWAEEEEQVTFGTSVEVVDADVDSQISTAAPKQTGNVWGAVPISTSKPEKPAKSEPYRPGAQLMKKKVDNYFPALGTAAPAETQQELQPKDTSNRFSELQEKETEQAAKPTSTDIPKGKKKKKKEEWKTVDLNAKVATTDAEKDLLLQDEANKQYEPKIVKSYPRQERRSDFPSSGEPDTTWRKAGEVTAPSEPRPAIFSVRRDEPIKRSEDAPPRRDEPFRRGEDAPPRKEEPFRRGEEAAPRRDEPFRRGEDGPAFPRSDATGFPRSEAVGFPRSEAAKTEPGVWRSAASQQAAAAAVAAPVETERKEVARPKFTNTKKKTESTEEPREDEWKAADKQAQSKPKVNMWEKGDPRI